MSNPRVAIVYDRLNAFGGAEQVLLALHAAFPGAPLYTSVWSKRRTAWLAGWEIRTSFLQHLPIAREHHQWFGWFMPIVFESIDLSEFDIVISVTSEAAKGVLTTPKQLHICYCLTPTRYLWSHTYEYAGIRGRWIKQLAFSLLRDWDWIAAARPDVIVPISRLVQKRIQKYYRRHTEAVIYPPVSSSSVRILEIPSASEPYYLVVSRLVPYKRVDLAIETCLRLGKRLKIVGIGTDYTRLVKISAHNPLIEFLGFVVSEKLDMIYAQAQALIVPQAEDFGIVSVEAALRGIPVISYAESGIAETIQDKVTGVLFSEQTTEGLVQAIEICEATSWDRATIQESANKYNEKYFIAAFQALVQKYCRIES